MTEHKSQPDRIINDLTREEIYAIFSRHKGAAYQLAGQIERSRCSVSAVLRGKATSHYILSAAHEMAKKLLTEEKRGRAA